ncbi:MAG: acetyl-CoA carboxylase biotin carboxylase subunit [candidate division Zixibacteria bacterium]|nr:acetyl-CoA carboxylase biotin carboxylase subunit [Candidatus Tariuqbacter arcticus]
MFHKILIANRGEIAVRIIRTCREMGIPALAVYSEVDRGSLHIQLADEMALLGPPSPLDSYLNIERIIEIAQERGADAVHPGYGFLAENPAFAKRCEDEGITFIGPSSGAIELLGNKIASRKVMTEAGIPCTPGFEIVGMPISEIADKAHNIGYPVLIKAAAGGGGKGMRIVHHSKDLERSIEAARRESKSAFADDTVYLEKYLEKPRHIEFQILADHQGNIIHLNERECSIQRRHQKVVEETPSTAITPEIRAEMGQTAIEVVKASGYTNAGTVEFLYAGGGQYYFLEVNTRLQVEHPVTEETVGVDLVAEQIHIAAGHNLRLRQEDISQRGHAIECRIYAEDPANNFLPSSGRISFMKEPAGPGVRHDCGVYSGWEVPVHYDPILSKLIVWGPDRESSRKRMIKALENFVILGVSTTIEFLAKVLQHPDFIKGETYTDFIDKNFPGGKIPDSAKYMDLALIAAAITENSRTIGYAPGVEFAAAYDPWKSVGNWEIR